MVTRGTPWQRRPSYRFISPAWTWLSTEMVLQTEVREREMTHLNPNQPLTYEMRGVVRQTGRWMDVSCFILGSLWVPDHDISICSWDDPAFPGVEVVDLGSIWACDGNKAILIHFTSNLWIMTSTKMNMFVILVMSLYWCTKSRRCSLCLLFFQVQINIPPKPKQMSWLWSFSGSKTRTKELHIPLLSPRWRSCGPECQEAHEGSLWNHPCPSLSVWWWMDDDQTPKRSECRCRRDRVENKVKYRLWRSGKKTGWVNFIAHTFPVGSLGNWGYWGRGGEEVRQHGQQRRPSPDDSTAYHSAQRELWWPLRGPLYL